MLATAAAMLVVGVVAWAQNIDVKGTITAEGTGVHSFMGNVGIGTTSPGYKLTVAGYIASSVSDPNIGGTISIDNPGKTTAGTASLWRLYNMSGSYGNSLQFWDYDSIGCVTGGMCNPRLALMDNGNVGIGTTNPGIANLNVANSGTNVGLYVGSSSTVPYGQAMIEINPPSGATHIWAQEGGTRVFSVTPGGAGYFAGNVGIGTASPSARLHIHGNYNNDGSGGFLLDAADGGPGDYYSLRINPYVVGNAMVGYAFQTKSITGGTTIPLAFNNAGNVGIGTTSPGGAIDVQANGGHRLLTDPNHTFLTTPATGNIHITNNLSWTPSGGWVSYDSTQPQSLLWAGGGVIDLYTGSPSTTWNETSKLHISNNGNVGIGTTTPSYLLHVNGAAAGTSWTNLSSREYKEDLKYLDSSEYGKMLDAVLAMKPARYRYKKEYGNDQSVHLGFVAEEMPKEVLSPNGKGVDTYELVTYMAGAMKAQQAQLKAQLKAQQDELRQLRAKLNALHQARP